MSEFDPFAVMRTLDGPVQPSEEFGEALYDRLRTRLDESAVGAPQLPAPTSSLPQRGFLVAVAALVSVLAMIGLVSWLSPADDADVAVDPPRLSDPETPTSAVDHNPDPAVVSPGTGSPTSQPPATQNRGVYQFGGWQVLPASEFDGRQAAAVVWTGDQLIVWGGSLAGFGHPLDTATDTGGIYDPASELWVSMPPSPLSARSGMTALWTGDEMLVIGGGGPDGAAYDPATRLWRQLPLHQVPSNPAAVWTGTEAILWGGLGPSGVAYNPVSDSWRDIAAAPGSQEWSNPQAVWTGTEMIVWSEVIRAYFPAAEPVVAFDVAAYNPATDSWRQFQPSPLEFELSRVTGVWTGDELLLFGANFDRISREGEFADRPLALGVGFNPTTEAWRLLAEPPAAGEDEIGLGNHSAAWSGSRMLIWVGAGFMGAPDPELWSYDPATDTWERGASSPVNAEDPELIWTGDALYAYGGSFNEPLFRMLRLDLGPGGSGLPAPVGTTSAIALPARLPFEMLAVARDRQQSLVADYAIGTLTVYDTAEALLPLDVTAAVPLWEGWMTSVGGEVWWFPEGIARQPFILQNQPVTGEGFAPFSYFLPADGSLYSEAVWTVVPGAGYGTFDEPSIVRRISVRDGSVVAATELPPDAAPVVSARTGLLVNQNGWIDTGDGFAEDPATRKMMLVEPDGTLTALWHGWGLDLSLNRLVWLDCDDEGADCRVVVSAVTGPQPSDLAIGDDSVSYSPLLQPGISVVSPDGRWLIIEQIQTGTAQSNTALVRVDLATGEVGDLITYPNQGSFAGPEIVWSSDSEWVLVADAGPIAIHIPDGTRIDLSETFRDDVQIYAVASR